VDDLDRGTILTNDKSIKQVSSLVAKSAIVKYWPSPLKEGMVLHIGHWMQYVPARVEAASAQGDWHKAELRLKLDKMLVYRPGCKGSSDLPGGRQTQSLRDDRPALEKKPEVTGNLFHFFRHY